MQGEVQDPDQLATWTVEEEGTQPDRVPSVRREERHHKAAYVITNQAFDQEKEERLMKMFKRESHAGKDARKDRRFEPYKKSTP